VSLRERLAAQIAQSGPISVAQFMAAALYDPREGYYATRAAIGVDFTTAPEISQMFGELIGLWCAHEWGALGAPSPLHWIELGPGRGTLIADAWRASRIGHGFQQAARVSLLEVNAGLKAQQATALAQVGARADWPVQLGDVAAGPSLIIANEFFDCLPIRQFVRGAFGLQIEGRARAMSWRERVIGCDSEGLLVFGLSPTPRAIEAVLAPTLSDAGEGVIAETAPGLPAWVDAIAARLAAAPGRALIIDYAGDGEGDTLQAVREGKRIDPLAAPGECDLTARVDYAALKRLARASGLDVAGPVGQGAFLRVLGIDQRAEALARARPDHAEAIIAAHHRLTAADEMGELFQVLCLSSRQLPPPAGL
jgi:NADH dehydrogenase [ubiquinone] 1 alpha subcomplex assembly factor 7